MYRVYVMRHGLAEAGGGVADGERQLTQAGREILRAVVAGLKHRGIRFDRVLCSPLVRAVQTAEIVCAELADGAPRRVDSLRPGIHASLVEADVLDGLRLETLLVGHMPDVSGLVKHLSEGRTTLRFSEGMMACLRFDGAPGPTSGKLTWAMTPDEMAGPGSS